MDPTHGSNDRSAAEAPVAVVTGASRGLGAALATELVRRGHRVAACARTTLVGSYAVTASVDVADPHAVERFASEVYDRVGEISLWINNAGVLGPVGPVRTTDVHAWTEALQVNVLGAVAGSRAFLLRRAQNAVLVNVASRVSRSGVAGLAAYAATKAALVSLTESIALEEGGGLRVVAVLPPSIATDMQAILLAADPAEFPGTVESRQRRDAGEIQTAGSAARLLLDAVLDGSDGATILDLTGPNRSPTITDVAPRSEGH